VNEVRWKKPALILVIAGAVSVAIIGSFLILGVYNVADVSLKDVASNPQSFDGLHVRLFGYVVETNYSFGPKYVLMDFDDAVEIALDGKGGPKNLNLEPYVSFVFDGRNYTRIRNLRVNIVGYVHYIGFVIDAPSFYLDVERVEPIVTEIETIVIDFLKTTDVFNGGWDGTIKIREVYDHKFGGVVAVVEYTTVNAIHPHFMAEAIEHHTAFITIDKKGVVTSAFCIWGSFHENRIWDLINQRWIQG